MTKTEQTYKVDTVQQLIDLNEDITNFNLTFVVNSNDGSTFYALVVDQNTLDNGEPLEFKLAKGSISGNIISDKNVYQNYFLILKSEQPCECKVEITINEIPPVIEHFSSSTEYSIFTVRNLVYLIILCAICYIGYTFVFKKYTIFSQTPVISTKSDISIEIPPAPVQLPRVDTPMSVKSSVSDLSATSDVRSILRRLNKL